jgi:ABC-type nitrate/sulfonate/bicarbonate transport system permease component
MSTRPDAREVVAPDELFDEEPPLRTDRPGSERDERPSGIRRFLGNKWVLRTLFYGAVIVAWQATAVIKGRFFLPTIPETLRGLVEIFTEGFAASLLGTLQQLIVGFLIALVIAIPIGVLMGRFRIVADLLAPYVNTLFVTSKESLLPVIIVAVGIGFWYRTWVVILFAVFFPIINTAAGVRYVDQELRETARAFQTRSWRMFTRVYLPAAAPFVVAGIRLGFGMAMKGMVIAELWVLRGTGRLLETFSSSPLRLDLYYALVLLIVAIAVGTNEALKWAERRLRPASGVLART